MNGYAVISFGLGLAIGLWVRRLPSEREYEYFLAELGAHRRIREKRLFCYQDARLGIRNWRRRRYWRRLARHGAIGLLLCALWPVMTASAPLPAPAPAQPCSEVTATYLVRRRVERLQPSNGSQVAVPVVFAVGWSCVSADDAEAAWQAEVDRQSGR